MSEPAQRSDVVLFNFIFGPSPYTMPTFPFFLQSAEYSGADIVFVGDTRPATTIADGRRMRCGRSTPKPTPPPPRSG